MDVEHIVACSKHPECELRLGTASGNGTHKVIKFAWRDKNGRVARGGEFPVDALPQALSFAIRKGYIALE